MEILLDTGEDPEDALERLDLTALVMDEGIGPYTIGNQRLIDEQLVGYLLDLPSEITIQWISPLDEEIVIPTRLRRQVNSYGPREEVLATVTVVGALFCSNTDRVERGFRVLATYILEEF